MVFQRTSPHLIPQTFSRCIEGTRHGFANRGPVGLPQAGAQGHQVMVARSAASATNRSIKSSDNFQNKKETRSNLCHLGILSICAQCDSILDCSKPSNSSFEKIWEMKGNEFKEWHSLFGFATKGRVGVHQNLLKLGVLHQVCQFESSLKVVSALVTCMASIQCERNLWLQSAHLPHNILAKSKCIKPAFYGLLRTHQKHKLAICHIQPRRHTVGSVCKVS